MLSAEVMEMNIAIYGAGSLGTIMGAYLSETYPVVDLIDTNKEHVTQLNDERGTRRRTRYHATRHGFSAGRDY